MANTKEQIVKEGEVDRMTQAREGHRKFVKGMTDRIRELEEENEQLDVSATERQLEIYRLRKALELVEEYGLWLIRKIGTQHECPICRAIDDCKEWCYWGNFVQSVGSATEVLKEDT